MFSERSLVLLRDFPGDSMIKNPPANTGDASLILGSGKSPGGGNGNPLWYFCLENSTNRGPWWAVVHGATKELDMTEQLSTHVCTALKDLIIPET